MRVGAGREPTIQTCRLLGRIEGCTNPESAELLPDGETVVFGNCAIVLGIPDYRGGRGITYGHGDAFVSQARLDGDGLILINRRLVENLTGTHGTDILHKATGRIPAGTAFITEGAGPQTVRGSGKVLAKSEYCTNLTAYDPVTGEVRGRIPLGSGSALAARFRDLEQPNGLAIGWNGDIYVSDMAPGAEVPGWEEVTAPAIYRIPHAAIDRVIAGGAGSADAVQRIPTPGKTNGLAISYLDGSLLSVSCSPDDPVGGGIFRYTPEDFERGRQPVPIIGGLGIIDGIGETRRGTIVASVPPTSEIHLFPSDGRHLIVRLEDGNHPVARPADVNVCYPKVLGGEPALLVPDVAPGAEVGAASVAMIDLSGF